MVLPIYGNELILTANDNDACSAFKPYLHRCFHIKNLGPLKYSLRIEVACNLEGLFFSQFKYALEIVDECGILGAKSADFLMEASHQ